MSYEVCLTCIIPVCSEDDPGCRYTQIRRANREHVQKSYRKHRTERLREDRTAYHENPEPKRKAYEKYYKENREKRLEYFKARYAAQKLRAMTPTANDQA